MVGGGNCGYEFGRRSLKEEEEEEEEEEDCNNDLYRHIKCPCCSVLNSGARGQFLSLEPKPIQASISKDLETDTQY